MYRARTLVILEALLGESRFPSPDSPSGWSEPGKTRAVNNLIRQHGGINPQRDVLTPRRKKGSRIETGEAQFHGSEADHKGFAAALEKGGYKTRTTRMPAFWVTNTAGEPTGGHFMRVHYTQKRPAHADKPTPWARGRPAPPPKDVPSKPAPWARKGPPLRKKKKSYPDPEPTSPFPMGRGIARLG